MSRAHCLDCGTEVPVDPLGHCPAGHLLPTHGRQVESAIGNDDHHPDEPEPWVAQVVPAADEEPDDTASGAQPRTAPGFDPARAEADTGDLLRELGALGSDDPGPSPSASAGDPAAGTSPPPTTPPAPETASPPPTTPPPAPEAASPQDRDPEVSELSALEQAIQSLDDHTDHHAPGPEPRAADAPPPATSAAPAPGAPAPAAVDELSSLFDEVAELDGGSPSSGPSPAPAPAPPRTEGQVNGQTAPPPAPPAAASNGELHGTRPVTEPPPSTPASRSSVDTMNFTAKGGAMNDRRRRRRFGR